METVRNVIVLAMVGAAFAAVGAEQTASEIKEIRFKALTSISGPGFELLIRRDGNVEYIQPVRKYLPLKARKK